MSRLVDIEKYTNDLTEKLKSHFGDRLLYVGLQGSYLRGEATENSDIDIMLVFDNISASVLKEYREILICLGEYDRACGFVCGREELLNWNPQEICHVLHTTKDIYGKLQDLIPSYSKKEIADYIKISVCNLDHMLCHRLIHSDMEKNINKLPMARRDIFFILQNLYYLENGEFIQTKSEVTEKVSGSDLRVWECLSKEISYNDFDEYFNLVMDWCKDVLIRTSGY